MLSSIVNMPPKICYNMKRTTASISTTSSCRKVRRTSESCVRGVVQESCHLTLNENSSRTSTLEILPATNRMQQVIESQDVRGEYGSWCCSLILCSLCITIDGEEKNARISQILSRKRRSEKIKLCTMHVDLNVLSPFILFILHHRCAACT